VPNIGSALLDWLVADFDFFGWDGQNWMVVLFAGAAAIFVAIMVFSRGQGGTRLNR
jgi:hypothetical protein